VRQSAPPPARLHRPLPPPSSRSSRPKWCWVKPCGFDLSRTLREADLIEPVRAAAVSGQVYLTDGNAVFNRPGPRLLESLEILAACVHPDLFEDFRHKHRAVLIQLERGAALPEL